MERSPLLHTGNNCHKLLASQGPWQRLLSDRLAHKAWADQRQHAETLLEGKTQLGLCFEIHAKHCKSLEGSIGPGSMERVLDSCMQEGLQGLWCNASATAADVTLGQNHCLHSEPYLEI